MSIEITLPDGSVRSFENPITGLELAADIGPGLAKQAVAIAINDEMLDLSTTLDSNTTGRIITRHQPEALELIRHDAAPVMAQAVKELYPETQVTHGPAIENGFYYIFFRE